MYMFSIYDLNSALNLLETTCLEQSIFDVATLTKSGNRTKVKKFAPEALSLKYFAKLADYELMKGKAGGNGKSRRFQVPDEIYENIDENVLRKRADLHFHGQYDAGVAAIYDEVELKRRAEYEARMQLKKKRKRPDTDKKSDEEEDDDLDNDPVNKKMKLEQQHEDANV